MLKSINHTVHNTTQNKETPKRWTLESNCCWGGVQENAPSLYSSKHQRLLLKPSRKLESSGVFSAEKIEVSKKIGPKNCQNASICEKNMFLIFCCHIFSPTSFPQKGWRKFPRRGRKFPHADLELLAMFPAQRIRFRPWKTWRPFPWEDVYVWPTFIHARLMLQKSQGQPPFRWC